MTKIEREKLKEREDKSEMHKKCEDLICSKFGHLYFGIGVTTKITGNIIKIRRYHWDFYGGVAPRPYEIEKYSLEKFLETYKPIIDEHFRKWKKSERLYEIEIIFRGRKAKKIISDFLKEEYKPKKIGNFLYRRYQINLEKKEKSLVLVNMNKLKHITKNVECKITIKKIKGEC